jgi:hypothetical protein
VDGDGALTNASCGCRRFVETGDDHEVKIGGGHCCPARAYSEAAAALARDWASVRKSADVDAYVLAWIASQVHFHSPQSQDIPINVATRLDCPPAVAARPSQGWIRKQMVRNTGIQGKSAMAVGPSRGIGLETVKAALEAGHSVRALARSARKIHVYHPKLEKWPATRSSWPR